MSPVLVYCFPVLLGLFDSASSTTSIDGIKLNNFRLDFKDDSIRVSLDGLSFDNFQDGDVTGKSHLPIELGVRFSKFGLNSKVAVDLGSNRIEFEGTETTLQLRNNEGEERCTEVSWLGPENATMEDCFRLSPHNWYGGPEQTDQYWPVEQATYKNYSYVPKELHSMAIAEPYWLNSDGLMIYVHESVPLFIDQNNHRKESLCLIAKHAAPYERKGRVALKYTVCKFDDPRTAHEYAIKTFLGKPTDIPDTRIVEHPIWSTWAKYKSAISDKIVLSYAKAINDHGFKNSQFEIDDIWEACYGSLTFNKTTFPNMKATTSQLNKMGFRTTVWTHPFVNLNCEEHREGVAKGYFVKNTKGEMNVPWWNGEGSHIDFTNPAAAEWYETRLRKMLAEGGIDSLKFDAGEGSFAPQVPVLHGPESLQPGILTTKYAELAAKFAPMVEVRSQKGTQHLPIFTRMLDRESEWGMTHNGLHSVITATFMMNMNGYPFVLPDMVGGNAYNNRQVTKEMFIRYLQVNVFLPAIQFSFPPWDYDAETIELSKKYLALHYQYSGKIIELMRRTVKTGQPINMPIWWVDPTNKEAHGINSEYMLGEDILVAPVLKEGATSRDIYLPKGQWRDEAKPEHPVHEGPVWLRAYPAPLDTLPYFTRLSSSSARVSFSLFFFVTITCFLTLFR